MDGCKAIYKGISTAGETILGDMGHSLLYAIHPSRITHRTSAHLEVTTIVPELRFFFSALYACTKFEGFNKMRLFIDKV